MLSSPFYKSSNTLPVNRAICTVMQDLQALAVYVQRRMAIENWSLHEVARRSGGAISHGTVSNILNASSKEVKDSTLRALAKGLDVSEEEIFAITRGKPLQPSELTEQVQILFNGWETAAEEDKADTLAAIQLIAEGFQRRRRRKRSDAPRTAQPQK